MEIQSARKAGNDIPDDASLGDRVPNNEQAMIEDEEDDIQNQIRRLNEKTQALHADEQFLKEELKVREKQTLETYERLTEKKKELLELVKQSFNKKEALMDISLTEEFQELRRIIEEQESKIERLRNQVSQQGLAGVTNDENYIRIRSKTEEVQREIKTGRKFASTQYVRDYLQRPQAYKVSYEQAKYQYEMRLRLKESLQQQKQLYEKKKEQLTHLKKKQREIQQELLKERDFLQR